MDVTGDVFVSGYSTGSGSGYDYATIKYSGAGMPLWTNRYNGPGNGLDRVTSMAANTNGGIFVTGYSTGTNLSLDYATIKYSSAGLPLWTNRYNGPASSEDRATAIAVDGSGQVFVAGYSTNSDSGFDFAIICYSSDGVPVWTNRYNGPGNNHDFVEAIAVDYSGNVIVTGETTYRIPTGTTYSDFATIKYSNAGLPLWTNRFNGPYQGNDGVSGVSVDAKGNIFVTGSGDPSYAQYAYRYETIAYSGTGVSLWTNYSSFGGLATAIAADRNGNVIVTGYSADYVTIKYSILQPIPLAIQNLNNQMVVSWTNTLFGLQSAPVIAGNFTNIPGATSPYTNSIIGPQQFFRLILY